jgi:ribulose-5-phosphate 4-epimerase/fuculose-1-phosphate aldolase
LSAARSSVAKDPVYTPEWAARIDLAAAHRLAVQHGLDQVIYNHLTLTVPGTTDQFFLLPFGLHWAEVTASDFMTLDYAGRITSGGGTVQRSALCIHAPIHRAYPRQHACVLHTHMPYASALTRLEDPRLLPIGQTEVLLIDQVAYDMDYTGLARDLAEGERLAGILGPGKSILFLANHGVVVTGRTVAEAYDRLYSLERACQFQLFAMWTGKPLKLLPQSMIDTIHAQYAQPLIDGGQPGPEAGFELFFASLKRMLDESSPSFRS